MVKSISTLFLLGTILSFCSCKKVFDKDYYKDCVGEDRVSGDVISFITPQKLNGKALIYGDWSYKLDNSEYCIEKDICSSIYVVKKDSFTLFKKAFLHELESPSGDLLSTINSLDSSKHSVIGISYFYYPEPSYRYYFVSNTYHVTLDTLKNELVIFYQMKKSTKGNEKKSQTLEFAGTTLIINKVINANTKVKMTYYESYCN